MSKDPVSEHLDSINLEDPTPQHAEILNRIKPSALSVDITNLCNLRCQHCFWSSYADKLPPKTNVYILDSVAKVLEKYPSITNITWYGGEPMINAMSRQLLADGIGRFQIKNNLIITNGTFPLLPFKKNTHYAVSLDGPEKINDLIRGDGTYAKSKHNIQAALSSHIPVAILFCINALNLDAIPEFLSEWSGYNLEGIVFTCFAPLKSKSSALALTNEQRNDVSELLSKMKHSYEDLICNTETMIELLKSKYNQVLMDHCPMNALNSKDRVYSIHLCNNGVVRLPCALGEDADCLGCRSVTRLALYAGMTLKDRNSVKALFRMYHSKHHQK